MSAAEVLVWCEDENPTLSRRRALDGQGDPRGRGSSDFEWGYCGSGPARLALAILTDHLRDSRRALDVHQEFKGRVVANLPRNGWQLTARDVDQAVQAIEAEFPSYRPVRRSA